MIYSLSEVITKQSKTLVEPLRRYLNKHPVYIFTISGRSNRLFYLSKSTAYAQLEMIKKQVEHPLNDFEIEREDYHDLDNRLDRLILTDGTIFEISQHRILW